MKVLVDLFEFNPYLKTKGSSASQGSKDEFDEFLFTSEFRLYKFKELVQKKKVSYMERVYQWKLNQAKQLVEERNIERMKEEEKNKLKNEIEKLEEEVKEVRDGRVNKVSEVKIKGKEKGVVSHSKEKSSNSKTKTQLGMSMKRNNSKSKSKSKQNTKPSSPINTRPGSKLKK